MIRNPHHIYIVLHDRKRREDPVTNAIRLLMAGNPDRMIISERGRTLFLCTQRKEHVWEVLSKAAGKHEEVLTLLHIDPAYNSHSPNFQVYNNDEAVHRLIHLAMRLTKRDRTLVPPPVGDTLVDRILDRINRVGLDGLYPVERRLLDRYANQH